MNINLNLQHILYPQMYPHPRHLHSSGAYQRLLMEIIPSFLTALLAATRGNKAHAARLAGFDRSTLERKLSQYHMVVEKQLRVLPVT